MSGNIVVLVGHTLQCYKLIPVVHIMPILVALDAEVLVTKHFNPAAFGVLLFSVLVITMRLLFCFCTMESLRGFGVSGRFLVCFSPKST